MFSLLYTVGLALLASESVSPKPLPQALYTSPQQAPFSGGPPKGIYGRSPTPYGPVSPGTTKFPSTTAKASPVDELFQNLLSAEWIVQDFYLQGVNFFNQSDFSAAGFASNTFERLTEILQNENGHLKIFEAAISPGVTKPSKCKYDYGFQYAASKVEAARYYMYILSEVELGSLVYLTGLGQDSRAANSVIGISTVTAVLSVEARHLSWVNSGPLNGSPFAGPSDTAYPWALQVLSQTKQFILPGSCLNEDPLYPIGDQLLPKLRIPLNTSVIAPGGYLDLTFEPVQNASTSYNPDRAPPNFKAGQNVTFTIFHQLWNYTVTTVVPKHYKSQPLVIRAPLPPLTSYNGMLIIVMSNTTMQQPLQPDRPQDVIAGPLLLELDFAQTIISALG